MNSENQCEHCQYNTYDEDWEEYCCEMHLDMDELAKLRSGDSCPYFRYGDEYTIVKKQI